MHTRSSAAPPPFLMKTYELVEDEKTDDVISWNESGTAFVVWKSSEFATDLLPTYFKHDNFSSFVRQLNTYGFRKIVPGRWEFANEFFKKGHKDLLSEIHRKKSIPASPPSTPRHQLPPPCGTNALMTTNKSKGENNIHPSSSLSYYSSGEDHHLGSTSSTTTSFLLHDTKVVLQAATTMSNATTTTTTVTELSNISGENEQLRKDNQILSSKLARIKKQCEDLMSFLSTCNHDGNKLNFVDMIKGDGNKFNFADMIKGVGCGRVSSHDPMPMEVCCSSTTDHQQDNNMISDDDEKAEEEEEECLKLFGVWLKGKKKRGRDDHMNACDINNE